MNAMAATNGAPPWLLQLLRIPALRLRLPIACADAPLPGASAVRGAIGHQLMACDDRSALACLFPATTDAASLSRWGACPPWALRVDAEQRYLEIALFADALPHVPALLSALLLAARGRIGECHGLRLGAVTHERQVGDGHWLPGLPNAATGWAPAPLPDAPQVLRFVSPLRLRRDGRDLRPEQLQPRDLLANLLRRLTTLALQSDLGEPHWDAHALLARSAALQWHAPRLSWSVLGRYSQRQQAEMHLGGVVGTAHLTVQELPELWPVLWMGQFIHAGKTPTLGMGHYTITSVTNEPTNGGGGS